MLTRRSIMAAGAVAPLLAGVARADAPTVAPTPPTIDELLREPTVLDTALSPDGNRVAVLRELREGDRRVSYILINTVENLASPPTRVVIGDYDVEQVEWANDERLLVWIAFTKAVNGKPTGLYYGGEFVEIPVRRILAIGVDGRQEVVLFANQAKALKRDFDLSRVVDLLSHDPRAILMQMWDYGRNVTALHRVDVYTGEATLVERGAPLTDFWFMQDGVPVLRYDSDSRRSVTVFARAPGETDWKKIRKFRRSELEKIEGFDVVGATKEPGVLLVSHLTDGEDARTIRRFDLRTLTLGDVVMKRAGRDLESVWIDENRSLVAAGYTEDRQAYEFSDPRLAAHFKGLNAYFKSQMNVRLFDLNIDHNRMLLRVRGPTNPGSFYLYNRDAKSLDLLAEQKAWLGPERLAPMETLKVRTRDGAEITAYLTTPLKPGPNPLVVLPHGGPEQRDSYDFDLFVQALAARGWMVLQPNFRGSGGYGRAFADAGRRRWADRMQEDVEDCIEHVLKMGRADPKRVAITGASYGGYAAMMGIVRRPELYRPAVSIAGPCDLKKMLDFEREDGADSPNYLYWSRTIGDPKTGLAAIQAASPINHVGRIVAPLLLIHGKDDGIVPAEQSHIMARAMKKAGKTCVHEELKDVGHSGWTVKEWKKILGLTTDFLAARLDA